MPPKRRPADDPVEWLNRARSNLARAKADSRIPHVYLEDLCFDAQQAAEKAVKALYQSIHIDSIGHSISRMLSDLPISMTPQRELIERGKELDKHYIPARYPNSHPEGAPMDYYTQNEARRALEGAEIVIEFCRSKIPQDQLR